MNHRDPNQGTCTNACRWNYKTFEGKEDITGNVSRAEPVMVQPDAKTENIEDKVFLIEEPKRPGEYMPVYEDEHGTYIMNSKDLRAVQHVERLAKMGIDSLKIEGRTKSHYYTARTAQVYRRAIDDALAGKKFDMQLMADLDNLANRGYTEGFYRRHVPEEYQNYQNGSSVVENQRFVGEVVEVDEASHMVQVDVKNKFLVGDTLEVMSPQGNFSFKLEHMEDVKGNAMQEAKGGGYVVRIPMPSAEKARMGLLMRYI
jgi:putative protease